MKTLGIDTLLLLIGGILPLMVVHGWVTPTSNHLPLSSTGRRCRSISPLRHPTRVGQPQTCPPTIPTPSTTSTSRTAPLNMMMDMTVAQASLAATAKLLSSIGLGGLAALKPNLLDAAAISALSRLTYWMFQPAFLFGSVSKTLYTAATTTSGGLSLRALWLLPALACGQIMAGAVLGRVLAKLYAVQGDAEIRNVRMCTTFGNSGPLPLIFADALFGSNALLQSQMAAGISFYLLAWSPLFWTLGKVILASEDEETTAATSDSKWAATKATLTKIMSPPVIGSLAGLVVGLVPWLRNLFFGPTALLRPLYGALHTLGTAYLPAALLVLAGSLVGKRAATDDKDTTAAPTMRGMAAIATYRFLVSPLLTLGAAAWLQTLTWMDARTKAIVVFLCLMEGCMPPAQNSVILLQLANRPGPAAAMAKLLTILYTAAVLPVTILLTACLQQSGILAYL